MNSTLAQLNQGLITSYASEENSSETLSETHNSSMTKKSTLGGKLVLNANFGFDKLESEQTSKAILEGQRDILNKAFHDYALQILIDDLESKDLIKENGHQGDFQLIESSYKFYDFELIHNLADTNSFNKLMSYVTDDEKQKQIDDAKRILKKKRNHLTHQEKSKLEELEGLVYSVEQPIKALEMMEHLSGFIAKSLKGLIIIKLGNFVSLAKREFLRESSESISFRTDQSRKVKILFRINGKKGEVYSGDIPDLQNLNIEDIDTLPNMIFDLLLGSFDILKKDDVLVTPIAIYYE